MEKEEETTISVYKTDRDLLAENTKKGTTFKEIFKKMVKKEVEENGSPYARNN